MMDLDPYEEVRQGRADSTGAEIYRLYCAVRKNDFKGIARCLKSLIKHEGWRQWRWIGQEFSCSSLRECLLTPPPKGVGADLTVLKRLIQDDTKALEMLDQALTREGGRPKAETLYNIQGYAAPSGTSPEAALRRLRKDERPFVKELYAKVLAGELSPHRAAVLAGYRKEPTPLEQIKKLYAKLTTAAERRELWSFVSHKCTMCGRDDVHGQSGPCDACCDEHTLTSKCGTRALGSDS
jgi:hypothetical protein